MSQNKPQLQLLTEFLTSSLAPVVKKNNIDAWQERGTLIINGEYLGKQSYQVAKWKHTGVISVENFPQRRIDPYNLLALISAFLISSEWPRDEYGLTDPKIDIEEISHDNATVLIELQLIDNIEIIPNANGPILFNGERYKVALAQIDIAEDVSVASAS